MNPAVSIIIPVYNIEKYIRKCVESVEKQTFCNMEIILVDDGSTDSSGTICDELGAKNKKIRVIHKLNGGLSSARNAGLECAVGDIIYFLDGDDYIDSTLLQDVCTKMYQSKADMVIFNYVRIDENGEKKAESNFLNKAFHVNTQEQKFNYISQVLLKYYQGWEAWNRVYSGKIIRENGLRFVDNAQIYAEDLLFLMMYLIHANSIEFMNKSLYYYLSRESSIMSEKGLKCNLEQVITLSWTFYQYILKYTEYQYIIKNNYLLFGRLIYNECINKKRNQVKKSIYNLNITDYVMENIELLWKQRNQLYKTYEKSVKIKMIYFCYMFLIELRIFRHLCNNRFIRKFKEKRKHNKKGKHLYLIGTEDFGNLGDHQIAVSMIEFIDQFFGDYNFVEIPASSYRNKLESEKEYIRKKDVIFLPGGGNIGDKYLYSEEIRRYVISTFPQNRIVIFPQTIDFEQTLYGREELDISRNIYNGHKRLLLAVREERSYNLAKEYFMCEIVKCPDIVLFSDYSFKYEKCIRKGILLCLRSDSESVIKQNEKEKIEDAAAQYLEAVSYVDNQLSYSISIEKRETYLNEMLRKYAMSKLVITDRLHGMIFATITGTPCIAIDNCNNKVRGVYEWLERFPYIIFCDKIEEIDGCMEQWNQMKGQTIKYNRNTFKKEYMALAIAIRRKLYEN